ncbi:MAG: VWA domain-containing protein [Methanomicrobiales archaeon]|nr:VWA domain-containing protein [Methanomicrobiales archaeon]
MCWILVALVLLTGTGTALTLKTSGPDWLVAGGGAGSLSLEISGGSGPFTISAAPATPLLCTVTPDNPFTSTSNKPPAFQVIPTEKSGICEIDVKVMDVDGKIATSKYFQKIDHTTPTFSNPDLPARATVGTIVPVSIWLEDTFHNRVDNRNIVENVSFYTGGKSGFVSGPSAKNSEPRLQSAIVPVDANGYATVYYYVGEYESGNYIWAVSPPRAEPNPWYIIIYGALGGTPVSLFSQISPETGSSHWVYADGSSVFTVTYTVLDANGFPAEAAEIIGKTSDGRNFDLITNEMGQASYFYGPFSSPRQYTITAALRNNTSVTVKDTLESIAMGPDHLVATANPPSLPSLEVSSSSFSHVTGRVADPKGNPIKNEKVTFQITGVTSTKPMKAQPYLTETTKSKNKYYQGSPVTVTTNNDGNAIVAFIPGEFAKSVTDKDYDPMANGTATVKVVWGSKTETVKLTFQRTAYLFLETNVVEQTVKVGEYFDVTVNVTGDGKMLRKNPVEVMLVTDRSGSMQDYKLQGQTRFYWVKQASQDFLRFMNPSVDKVGLVSYHTWATRDADLTSDFTSLGKSIDNLTVPAPNGWVPKKGPVRLTNMREGLFNATSYLKNYGSKDANVTKAIVLLTDGVWNWGGNPIAQGRGYPERTRLVVWEDWDWGQNCSLGSRCLNTYHTEPLYWPGLPSFHMYTYYNPELYKNRDGTGPVMDNPGSTIYTGNVREPVTRPGGLNEMSGYLCHPRVPVDQNNGPDWAWFMCTKDENCGGTIGCEYSKYWIDICDGTCANTEQNMAIFAKNNNIRVYTITYAETYDGSDGSTTYPAVEKVLKYISETTGGKYYHAATGDELSTVYEDIALDLIKDAGLDLDISADSSTVDEIQTGDSLEGAGVFDYVELRDKSTVTTKWEKGKVNPIEGPAWSSSKNEWEASHKIGFKDISSLKIGQTWQMKYRLKALKAGTYNVFGNASFLNWTDWQGYPQSIGFPMTPITVLDTGAAAGNARLLLDHLRTEDESGLAPVIRENAPFTLKWTLNYSDTNPNGKANLKVEVYATDGRIYHVEVNYPDERSPTNSEVELFMPWAGLEQGFYEVKVKAYGTGNSALPVTWPFEVRNMGERSQIIIR